MNLTTFYNRYHKKNSVYTKVIGRRNFTYFYILNFLHQADLKSALRGQILDVGCGVGTLALYVSQFAKKVVGIDISDRAIKIAQQAARFNQRHNLEFKVETLSPRKNKYDLIIATEIIEHIHDDKKLVQAIYTSLKPGGHLLLSTPSNQSRMYHWGWYRHFDQEVGHLRRYQVSQLKKLLKNQGFQIKAMTEKESLLRSYLFTSRLGILIRFIRGPMVHFFHTLDEVVGRVFGFTDIIVLAQKKR